IANREGTEEFVQQFDRDLDDDESGFFSTKDVRGRP
ncbi:MAG: hypothetical protein K1000chlam4_00332, partial [Chlamydiae bacterium]|nr:hypothetical protein [Chlamydiota bacterium]